MGYKITLAAKIIIELTIFVKRRGQERFFLTFTLDTKENTRKSLQIKSQ